MYFLVAGLTAVYKIGHCIKPTFFGLLPSTTENSLAKFQRFPGIATTAQMGLDITARYPLDPSRMPKVLKSPHGPSRNQTARKIVLDLHARPFKEPAVLRRFLIKKPGTKKRAKSMSTMRKATDKKSVRKL